MILVKRQEATLGHDGPYAEPFYWRYGPHKLPVSRSPAAVEIRRYNLCTIP